MSTDQMVTTTDITEAREGLANFGTEDKARCEIGALRTNSCKRMDKRK